MSNQTLRKPPSARPKQGQSKSGNSRSGRMGRYSRQTARGGAELRRDGKPLIFGWGRHLSRLQKNRIQTRAAYGFFGAVVAIVLVVFGFGVLQQNVLIPNQAIVSVNNTSISQDSYRKYLAYQAQVLWNKIQSELKEQQAASTKAQTGDKAASQRNQVLISLLQTDESSYLQSSITLNSVDRLEEDQLIQQGIQQLEAQHVAASHFTVSASAVNAQLASFKKSFPAGETYQQFLSKDSLSDGDVRAAITIDLRRNLMQTYLASLIFSPTKQVHLRKIEVDTRAHANTYRAELVKNPSNQEWSTLAKQNSLDPTTKTVGGDMGWVFRGGTDAAIEAWAFSPGVKVNDISPVIADTSGTFDVVQVLGVDPSRAANASELSAAQTNALDHWLSGQKANKSTHITTPDTTMTTATRNMPVIPDLNATLPNFNPNSQSGGSPSSVPGSTIPGQ